MLERMWRNRNIFTLLVGVQISSTIVEDSVAIPQGSRNRNSIDLAIPLLDIYPKDHKSFYYKDTCTQMFIAALFTTAKTWNQPKCPSMLDWSGKMWHIHHGIPCSHKKLWVRVLCRDLDESGNHHSQKTDTEQKIKHHTFSLTGGCWTIRTHGHREGSITHWGLLGGTGEGQWGTGRMGRNNMGRNARYRWWEDGGSTPHCHVCAYVTILLVLHMYPRT